MKKNEDLDRLFLFDFLDKLNDDEKEILKLNLKEITFVEPKFAIPKNGFSWFNASYQTRVVCPILGVDYVEEKTNIKYLRQLAVVKRITLSGKIKEFIENYFKIKEEQNAKKSSSATFEWKNFKVQ